MASVNITSSGRGLLLVAAQFLCAGTLALTGPLVPLWPGPALLGGLGCAVAAWAMWVMRPGRFNVTPDPHPHGALATRGPYRMIRHPMYAGVLLLGFAWWWSRPIPARLLLWIALWIVLDRKARLEEKLLGARFPGYVAYARRTARFIPGVY